MKWSYSHSRTFRRCPRQWYFATQLAKGTVKKDPLRREAFLLSKLQSVSAWRGQLVDRVIGEEVIHPLSEGAAPNLERAIAKAEDLFRRQLEFARLRRWREPGVTVKKDGRGYAALYGFEYGQDIEEEIVRAWADVEQALVNLFEMDSLLARLRQASQLMTQRTLMFRHSGVTVVARPDLIAVFDDSPPLIVDWKVHTFGIKDYRLQLAVYAVALTRCRPHKDFAPALTIRRPATEVELVEAQLLRKTLREHSLTEQDIEDIDNYISASALQMLFATGAGNFRPTSYFDLSTTDYPDNCQRCPFRSICWEGSEWEKEILCRESKQTSFLF